jgi:trehalose 6-phosphate synthase
MGTPLLSRLSLRPIVRYTIAALVIVAAVIAAISPFAGSLVEQWSKRDIELRSQLVFNSVRDELNVLLSEGDTEQIKNLFERLALDERLIAVGFCDERGTLSYHSKLFPNTLSCANTGSSDTDSYSTVSDHHRTIVVAAFPVATDTVRGHLILLHDLTFAARRGAEAQNWILLALAGVALIGGAVASIIALLVVQRWLQSVRNAIDDVKTGRPEQSEIQDDPEIAKEIRDLMRESDETRRSIDATYVDWNPEMLRLTLANELPGAEIIVVSNREPYIHNRTDDKISVQIPASGLVAAIEPMMRACGGTWVAHGSGTADQETVDARDCIMVPPGTGAYKLRRVWLTDEEQDGYYYGFANEGLWPLCHIAFVWPTFRESDWNEYRKVNARFAQAVVSEATRPDPIILVQDYHFALLPRMIREKLPEATIITFWHIPWPNSETFGICPWKEEIVGGLLGSSVLGFHTQFHCNNFIETVDRFVESRIDREHASITVGRHETHVRPYPISIEWPPAALKDQKPVAECRAEVRARYGLRPDICLGVGIERFDYTKGILDRMRAVDSFLTHHPEWKGRFSFLQAAAPSRGTLVAYRHLQEEAKGLADEINARHGGDGYSPILLVIKHHEPDEVFELFRAADVCIVSSLHDGMNLVAKEFVAARDDERGVLILSNFAGASRELSEALIVNPYDPAAVGETIFQALHMPETEQRERLRLMRDVVRSRNVYRWAGQMLVDAAQLRKRHRILSMVKAHRTILTRRDVTGLTAGMRKSTR